MKKNVYLFQPNYGTGSGEYTTLWLPYSVGSLWAYASQQPDIGGNYTLRGLYFRRTPIRHVLAKMEAPAIVGFSNYAWNINYNRHMAKAVKETWPDAVILFGGPEVPDRPDKFLNANPFVDVTVHQEGEVSFTRLLQAYLNVKPDITDIPGISYRNERGEVIHTTSEGRIQNLDELPSPYLAGVFDDLIAENPGAVWAGTYETNRGCPFKCHFCVWGSLTFSKVKQFPVDRALRDLEWFGKNGIEYIFVADANFGIFKKRDDEIADHILKVVKETGYPKNFNIQWTKNSNDAIVAMARKLSEVQKGLTLSVQSMDEKVLTAIERRNMAINNLADILEICNKENVPSYTELILGLPEETVESWQENFHKLLDIGQHGSIDVWVAHVLQNSALGEAEESRKHAIETVEAKDYFLDAKPSSGDDEDDPPEVLKLVRSTRTMPFDDLIESYMYAWMVINFHICGWTQFVSRFLVKHGGCTYGEFYRALFDYVRSDRTSIIREQYEQTKSRITEYLTVGQLLGNLKDEIGLDMDMGGHNLIWISQIVLRYRGRKVFDELLPFLDTYGERLPPRIKRDLLEVQQHALLFHGESYPKRFSVGANLVESVFGSQELHEGGRYEYQVDYHSEVRASEPRIDSMRINEFLYMLYSRRRISAGTATFRRVPQSSLGMGTPEEVSFAARA